MKKQKIVISATFTAEPIEETLGFWMRELNLPFTIEFAPYNQIFQQLLDPSSLFSLNRSGINVLLIRFEDWQRFEQGSASKVSPLPISRDKIERNAQDLVRALKAAAEGTAAAFLVVFCPPSDTLAVDRNATSFFTRMETYIASELAHTNGVYLVQTAELEAAYSVQQGYDAQADALGHIPFTAPAFVAIGTLVARKIYALRNAPYKVVVLDCDQTLWKGVIGEDGVEGIEIDPARRQLQEFIIAQQETGMLICLCSKNNEEDVMKVFQQRTDMPLTLDRITAWQINWRAKSENLKSLAKDLNLGLDSFIFIDDDPVVCAEVQANCPEVLTIQLPTEVDSIPRILPHIWAFDRLKVTQEDQQRVELYKQNAQRESLRKQSLSFEDFLASLSLEVKISSLLQNQLSRVSQLTLRTNQFNFTTHRRSEGEIQALCQSANLECLVVEVSDRFGDYGLVGLMMFQVVADAVNVDTFLLSCRTLGRGVEHRMLAKLGQIAKERNCARVNVSFIPTKKNQPALEFLEGIGVDFKQSAEDGYTYHFSAEFAAVLTPRLASLAPVNLDDRLLQEGETATSHQPAEDETQSKSQVFRRIYSELYEPEQILKAIQGKKQRTLLEQTPDYERPSSEDEIRLARIWEEVLAIEPIGSRDNFFDLGGTSLMAVRLFSELEKVFGKSLSLATLFEAPTIEQLVQILRQEQKATDGTSLVAIQTEGSKPPFFCVHAAGGNVLFYRDLAKQLGTDQPFYGLQAQKQPRHRRVEDMAAHYLREIRSLQGEGPYYIGGACFGGLVAFEMAQQLKAQGQRVALLVLFNTSGPGYPKLLPGATLMHAKFSHLIHRVEHHWGSLVMLPQKEKLNYLLNKANKAAKLTRRHFQTRRKALLRRVYKHIERPLPEALTETQNAIQEAQKNYQPKIYSGQMTLFRASKQPGGIYPDQTMGWNDLAAGGLEIHEVPGYHAAIIAEPRVQYTAIILKECLSRAQVNSQKTELQAIAATSIPSLRY